MDPRDIDIICVGAATQDVFAAGKALHAKRDVRSHSFVEQFPLGAKLELDHVFFDTGGGATNAAVTFARQGMNAQFAGKLGKDPAGAEVLRVLKREGVDTAHVRVDDRLGTGYSVILLADNGERTILAYRGASHALKTNDFSLHQMKGGWMYISSLAGNMDLLKNLLQTAHRNDVRVALNPGAGELANAKKLRGYLQAVDILIANREEMARLFGGESPVDTMLNAMPYCPYIVLTDGPGGSYASDGQVIYFAGQYQRVKVLDRTGAGDAFCSGFVAAIARGWPIEDALTLASANSTSVVQSVGAKSGILRGVSKIKKMKVKRVSI
ncbi:MAG TPA: carbohydrate kinase family protein [Candidatus Saccharimonadales bacterium]|nr:carbohydrate kinase family protein [Candidatus Saccharimonadales bacterium]